MTTERTMKKFYGPSGFVAPKPQEERSELADAQGFMDWWKENHERMEASDAFNHPIDYAAAAWDAGRSAALHESTPKEKE